MTVATQPIIEMRCRYRAIGKLSDPKSDVPTTTTSMTDRDAVWNVAVQLVSEGKWTEFYIKEVWSQ